MLRASFLHERVGLSSLVGGLGYSMPAPPVSGEESREIVTCRVAFYCCWRPFPFPFGEGGLGM